MTCRSEAHRATNKRKKPDFVNKNRFFAPFFLSALGTFIQQCRVGNVFVEEYGSKSEKRGGVPV